MKNGLKIYLVKKLLRNLDEETRNEILTMAVAKLYNTISDKDIIKEGLNRQWFIGDRPIPDQMKKNLMAEAEYLTATNLWKHLQDDVKYQANKMIFLESQDIMQLTAGKMFTYVFDMINTRLKNMSKGSGNF